MFPPVVAFSSFFQIHSIASFPLQLFKFLPLSLEIRFDRTLHNLYCVCVFFRYSLQHQLADSINYFAHIFMLSSLFFAFVCIHVILGQRDNNIHERSVHGSLLVLCITIASLVTDTRERMLVNRRR